ncbi:MAG: glycosyltransferase family 4 protein [Bacteroidales bacterium]|nr:glycosyltransferase family 4 protein [Bacteroidales bacterium]
MKVLYDSHIFSEQTFGGISRYFVELMNHLPTGVDPLLSLWASENDYLPTLKNAPRTIPLRHFPEHRKLYYFLNGIADKRALAKGGYDVFHPTGFSPYFIDRVKSPVVVTVHDMIYHHGLNPGKHTPEIIENMHKTTMAADRVIAISQATKESILKFYDIDESKIDVIYHGFTPVATADTPRPPYLPERYILFVGHRGGYKNFETLLSAFSIIACKDKNIQLLCTGRGFNKKELSRIADLGLSSRCQCRFIPSAEMSAVYANAECFVFPSKMEGFGMPILESFAAKCPAIISNVSCLPEIGGNGAIYFNPDDAEELAETILRTINDRAFRLEKISLGEKELKRFSWDKTALQTADTYLKAIGDNPKSPATKH